MRTTPPHSLWVGAVPVDGVPVKDDLLLGPHAHPRERGQDQHLHRSALDCHGEGSRSLLEPFFFVVFSFSFVLPLARLWSSWLLLSDDSSSHPGKLRRSRWKKVQEEEVRAVLMGYSHCRVGGGRGCCLLVLLCGGWGGGFVCVSSQTFLPASRGKNRRRLML